MKTIYLIVALVLTLVATKAEAYSIKGYTRYNKYSGSYSYVSSYTRRTPSTYNNYKPSTNNYKVYPTYTIYKPFKIY